MASQSTEEEGQVPSDTLVPRLLTVLPVEIRLQIYEEVFSGSRVRVRSINHLTLQGQSLTLRPSHHHQLLLVCHQIYAEALSTYWSSTIIHSALNSPIESVNFSEVMRTIPTFAQPVIREIRCNGFRESQPGLTFNQFVEQFARLETFVIEPTVTYVSRRRYRESNWSSEKVLSLAQRELQSWYPMFGLDLPRGVRFLQRVQFPVVVRSGGMRIRLGARHRTYPAKVRLESSSATVS